MASKSEVFEFSRGKEPNGFESPRGGAYNNRKHLKLWESGLFSG